MFSVELKTLRKSRKMTQAELAEILDVSQQAVGMWENNKAMPGVKMVKKIADVFNVKADSLIAENQIEEDDKPSYYALLEDIFKDEPDILYVIKNGKIDIKGNLATKGAIYSMSDSDKELVRLAIKNALKTKERGVLSGEQDNTVEIHNSRK